MQVLPEFFFTFGRFPGTIDHLPIISTGKHLVLSKKTTLLSTISEVIK